MNTKTLLYTLCLFAALSLSGCGGQDDHSHDGHSHDHGDHSHDDHGHDHGDDGHSHGEDGHNHTEFVKEPGPNGGRLIAESDSPVEFLLRPDGYAQLTFFDATKEPVAVTEQSASLVTGDRMNPTQISFVEQDGKLVSDTKLPEASNQPLVLSIVASPGSTPLVERFNLKTETCSGCDLSEYACICGH